jgi:hypothetical protein
MADHMKQRMDGWMSSDFELGLPSALKSTCRFTKGGGWYGLCLENKVDEIRHVLDREFKNPDQLAAPNSCQIFRATARRLFVVTRILVLRMTVCTPVHLLHKVRASRGGWHSAICRNADAQTERRVRSHNQFGPRVCAHRNRDAAAVGVRAVRAAAGRKKKRSLSLTWSRTQKNSWSTCCLRQCSCCC